MSGHKTSASEIARPANTTPIPKRVTLRITISRILSTVSVLCASPPTVHQGPPDDSSHPANETHGSERPALHDTLGIDGANSEPSVRNERPERFRKQAPRKILSLVQTRLDASIASIPTHVVSGQDRITNIPPHELLHGTALRTITLLVHQQERPQAESFERPGCIDRANSGAGD